MVASASLGMPAGRAATIASADGAKMLAARVDLVEREAPVMSGGGHAALAVSTGAVGVAPWASRSKSTVMLLTSTASLK